MTLAEAIKELTEEQAAKLAEEIGSLRQSLSN
jgi:hypothetical protein